MAEHATDEVEDVAGHRLAATEEESDDISGHRLQ